MTDTAAGEQLVDVLAAELEADAAERAKRRRCRRCGKPVMLVGVCYSCSQDATWREAERLRQIEKFWRGDRLSEPKPRVRAKKRQAATE